MPLKTKINIINKDSLELGLSTIVNEYLYFNNGSINKPGFRINTSTSKLQYSNDGITWLDFTITATGGDLFGPHTNAKVVGFNGVDLNLIQVPTDGQIFYYDASTNNWNYGSVGGDISGNITDVNVEGLNGIPLDLTAPEDGYAYICNLAQNKFIPSVVAITPPTPVIPVTGGDCSGNVNNITVIGLDGYPINTSLVPTNGQVIYYNSTQSKWCYSQINGDVTGALPDVSVVGLKGRDLSLSAPVDGDSLVYNSVQGKWNYSTISSSALDSIDLFNVGGRLTLESGSSYMTDSSYLNKTTLYWTPINGGRIGLYDGANWAMYSPGELSITSSGLAGADYPAWYDPDIYGHPDLQDPDVNYIGGKIYDVFMYLNSGTPTLIFGPPWTNDTTRSEELVLQDYILVQPTTKYRYLGSIRNFGYANESTIFEYTKSKHSLWNYYNRVKISVCTYDSNSLVNSWVITPSTAPIITSNVFQNFSLPPPLNHVDKTEFGYFDPCNTITTLIGISEDMLDVICFGLAKIYAYGGSFVSVGIAINSVEYTYNDLRIFGCTQTNDYACPVRGWYNGYNKGFSKINAIATNYFGVGEAKMYSDWYGSTGDYKNKVGLIADLYG